MQITKDSTIAGRSALELRSLFRKCPYGICPEFLADELQLSAEEAQDLLRRLVEEGLLKAESDAQSESYGLTVKGSALRQATAAKPVHRTSAEKVLRELIQRMVHVNESDEFLWGIEEAYVFGSYLTDAPRLGDLDVSFKRYRKEPDDRKFFALSTAQSRSSGRRFSNITEEICWPVTKVYLFLKNRSRTLSLADQEPLLADPRVPRKAIFLNRRPVE